MTWCGPRVVQERGGDPNHLVCVENTAWPMLVVQDVGDVHRKVGGRRGQIGPGDARMQSHVVDPQERPVRVPAELGRRMVGGLRSRRQAVLDRSRQLSAQVSIAVRAGDSRWATVAGAAVVLSSSTGPHSTW